MSGETAATVGDLVAAFLEHAGVRLAFGVVSVHNIPILDAMHRRGRIRFVPARGEAGATNMADASARISGGLGVVVTSTGTGAGNAAGALVEAATAGTPLLHFTGQVDKPFLDRGFGFLHEAPAQLDMLRAVSKAAFRLDDPGAALGVLHEAASLALAAPQGPVSIEIPIDVQNASVALPQRFAALVPAAMAPDAAALDRLAARMARARRPVLWLGGGAREAADAAARLAAMGIAIVTSAAGRGILAEDHALSLGAFGASPPVEQLYDSVDFMLVAGSHLRSNETRTYNLRLPLARGRIDVDPAAAGRGYPCEIFVPRRRAPRARRAGGSRLRGVSRPIRPSPTTWPRRGARRKKACAAASRLMRRCSRRSSG